MSDGHCFISYSTADGLEFTRRLADELESSDPQIPAWYDKRDIPAGFDWDDQIVEAIKTCKCLLFVMSVDSTRPGSDCKNEILFALRYKKPILPILLHKNAEPIFVLAAREYIDFTGGFKTGLPKLRKYVRELDLPEGILRTLKERLADAEHDLRRTTGEEANRIKVEIEDLNRQIETQQKVADNPQAAADQTQANIAAGLERERKPEKPVAAKTETKFINPPPGVAPNYFQDRQFETIEIIKFLEDDAQTLMTIVGRGGVGKTAMICRLLKSLENGQLPDDIDKTLDPIKIDGIIYLSESGSHRVNFTNIFYDLCKLLPSNAVQELDAVYKNPQGSTEGKMRALLDKFGRGRVVLLFDNFEPLVDTETFAIRDAELDESLRAFLNGTYTAVNIVITTRVAPRTLNLIQPGRQRVLILDEGLESPYAENILREMDSDGRLGLKSATDKVLKRAKDKTRGFPRALEALFAILASDRYTTLEGLLDLPLPENVVEALVGEAFNRLDPNAQKVMQALAVYNRPVTPAAVDYLLAPHLPAIDSAPILQRLANMHFARKESGRFYLHPVDREFAFELIPLTPAPSPKIGRGKSSRFAARQGEGFTQHDLTSRAADYFRQARKPRAEWKKLADLSAQLAEFDLRCAAGDYDTTADVLLDIDMEHLDVWGHYRLLIDLHEKLQGKIKDLSLARRSIGNLGQALSSIGKVKEAIPNYERALAMAKEAKSRQAEGAWLGNLGNAYADLGDTRKAIAFHEQALVIDREIGDRRSEGADLGNLGNAYADLGDVRKAIEFHEQALVIHREIGDRRGEGADLGNLGLAYAALGDARKAIAFHEQALVIHREIGDRRAEGADLGNLGGAYAALGDARKAIAFHEQALVIHREIGNRSGEGANLGNLGSAYKALGDARQAIEFYEQALVIAREIGDKRNEGAWLGNLGNRYSDLGDARKAIAFHEQALVIAREIGDRRGESIDLENTGHDWLSIGEHPKAKENYQQAIQVAEDISFPQTQNYARWGLAQAYLFQNDLTNARTAIEAALQYDVPQNNHNASAQHGIIALRQGDASAAREAFMRAIAQADEILAKTPDLHDALDAKGLALCGYALCADNGRRTMDDRIAKAIEAFRKARKIAPHAGVVKRNLRLFDELVKCDEAGVLKNVRVAVEGKE